VHLWLSPETDGDIHNHRWDFASRVLLGGLIERRYHVAEFGAGDWRLSECRKISSGAYVYQDRGWCAAVRHAESEYRQGVTYLLRYSVLHEALPLDDSRLITVFLQGGDRLTSTTVLSPKDRVVPAQLAPERLTWPELEDVLWQVVEHLPVQT
jgi:hypothetical protein